MLSARDLASLIQIGAGADFEHPLVPDYDKAPTMQRHFPPDDESSPFVAFNDCCSCRGMVEHPHDEGTVFVMKREIPATRKYFGVFREHEAPCRARLQYRDLATDISALGKRQRYLTSNFR